MTLLQSILLGIVQGLTEFLPISSSGHLVIVPHLLNWNIPSRDAFIFNVLVQVATLLGVFAYFWNDLMVITRGFVLAFWRKQPFSDPDARQGWYLILATIPAAVLGLALKDAVETAFSSPVATAFFLLGTALLLLIAERVGKRNRGLEQLTWRIALWIGFFQVLALFPGLSRSGATIAGGMIQDLKRPAAARFSFLMSIPIMLLAGLVASMDLLRTPNLPTLLPAFIPGFLTAAVTGYLAIRWLLGYLTRRPLTAFAIYCLIAGLITLGTSI